MTSRRATTVQVQHCVFGLLLLALTAANASAALATPPHELLLENVRIVDFSDPGAASYEDTSLLLRAGRIAFVGAAARAEAGSDAVVVDGAGRTLLPGLNDLHVHLWDEAELGAYLAHGITTIRNLSGMPFHLELAARIDRGEVAGPRLLTSGPILNSRGPNLQVNHQVVEDGPEARAAVRDQHAAGYRRLKVYSNLSREAYEAARDEAAALGMHLTGHPPEGRRGPGVPFEKPFAIAFEEVLDDGFETLEHVESIAWHGLRGRQDREGARELARRIAAAGIPVTATLVAHHNLYRAASEGAAFLERPGTEWLNPVIQAAEAPVHAAWLAADAEAALAADRFYRDVAGIFDEEGVLLVAGSDAGIFSNSPGLSLLDELALLVDAGLTPYRALRSATLSAAEALGETEQGCLGAGCAADLVLYDCDPLEDLKCLRSPNLVISQGRPYDREALAELKAGAASPNVARTLENLRAGLAAQGGDPAILEGLGHGGAQPSS